MAENVNPIVSNLSVNRQARPVAFRNLYGAFDNVNREILPISEVSLMFYPLNRHLRKQLQNL